MNKTEDIEKLRVTEIQGEPFRYLVDTPRSPKQPYLVDLTQRVDKDGRSHGECSCIYYSTTANPNYKISQKRVPYRRDKAGRVIKTTTECKHIAACNAYDHWHTTMKMRAAFKDGITS